MKPIEKMGALDALTILTDPRAYNRALRRAAGIRFPINGPLPITRSPRYLRRHFDSGKAGPGTRRDRRHIARMQRIINMKGW